MEADYGFVGFPVDMDASDSTGGGGGGGSAGEGTKGTDHEEQFPIPYIIKTPRQRWSQDYQENDEDEEPVHDYSRGGSSESSHRQQGIYQAAPSQGRYKRGKRGGKQPGAAAAAAAATAGRASSSYPPNPHHPHHHDQQETEALIFQPVTTTTSQQQHFSCRGKRGKRHARSPAVGIQQFYARVLGTAAAPQSLAAVAAPGREEPSSHHQRAAAAAHHEGRVAEAPLPDIPRGGRFLDARKSHVACFQFLVVVVVEVPSLLIDTLTTFLDIVLCADACKLFQCNARLGLFRHSRTTKLGLHSQLLSQRPVNVSLNSNALPTPSLDRKIYCRGNGG